MEVAADHTDSGSPAAGFGKQGKPDFWIGGEGGLKATLHVAIAAGDRGTVDAFYQRGTRRRRPGQWRARRLRPQYHPNYYGAFVLDPDGHNIEAVCRAPGVTVPARRARNVAGFAVVIAPARWSDDSGQLTTPPRDTGRRLGPDEEDRLCDAGHTRWRQASRAADEPYLERENNAIYFLTDARRHKDDEIARNPNVNLSFADAGDQKYVSVSGTAVVSNDRARIKQLFSTRREGMVGFG